MGLGADQFDLNDPQDKVEKESFFNWFYWSINLGERSIFEMYSTLICTCRSLDQLRWHCVHMPIRYCWARRSGKCFCMSTQVNAHV
jgi:hypothetical protein